MPGQGRSVANKARSSSRTVKSKVVKPNDKVPIGQNEESEESAYERLLKKVEANQKNKTE